MPGLYVHVPFCLRKCAYCGFASEVRTDDAVGVYLEALAKEASLTSPLLPSPETVYLGGGTPTALTDAELGRLFSTLSAHFDLARAVETTVEANPGTVDASRLGLLRSLGADRLSLGVQSFDDEKLRLLGRIHSAAEAEDAILATRMAGFRNVSVDIMFAVPGQTLDDIRRDVARAVDLGPEHVSVYSLTHEPGTRMTRMRDAGEIAPVSEELERDMYFAVIDDLEAAGLGQYEISNFARPGRESRHNLAYWRGTPYIGLGPSAASFVEGERRKNVSGLGEYCARLARGELPVAETERLDPERAAREFLMLMLRTRRGVSANEFRERTGFGLDGILGAPGRRLLADGWLEYCREPTSTFLRLSRNALPVADSVLAEII